MRGRGQQAASAQPALQAELDLVMAGIEVGVNDSFFEAAVSAIEEGGVDRGRIFSWELHDVIRIRTGETGPEAI